MNNMMFFRHIILFLLIDITYLCLSGNKINPPKAKIKPEYFKVQNFTLVDNYSWLKHYYDTDVKEYIRNENEYSALVLSRYKKLQKEIEQDLDKAEEKDIRKIWEYGSWTYYLFQGSDLEYPRYYRQPQNNCRFSPSKMDNLVLDYNLLLSVGEPYFMEGFFEVSEDGSLLAFGYDLLGNEEFFLRIWDLETQKEIEIPKIFTYYSVRWFSINNRTWVYYNVVDHGIPHIIRRLCVRNCEKEKIEEVVYEESDLSMIVEVKLSVDFKFLFIKISGQTSSEYLLVRDGSPLVIFIRDSYTIYDLDHQNNSLIIRVNDSPYINYRIVKISMDRILKEEIAHSILDLGSLNPFNLYSESSEFIELHEVFPGWIVLWIRRDGLREILVLEISSDASASNRISFRIENDSSSESYAVFPGSVDDMESRIYRSYSSSCLTFTNSSFSREPTMYWYNFRTQQITAQNVQHVYTEYLEKRVWVQSSSSKNERIPISLVKLKNLSGHDRPTVISSYGSYGSFKDPIFDSDLFPLLNRGMVFAICHPR
jgi:oligopeptidase B